MSKMTPREIVHELNRHIIGQDDAKRAVAIALRNRWRRSQLNEEMRNEVTPKNILMIGPTGVGKTEIARRLARLAHAPFVKVLALLHLFPSPLLLFSFSPFPLLSFPLLFPPLFLSSFVLAPL